ncbi:MAG: hypothetical protein CSA65_03550 [Proteobacteria bacterium]|nr:MAG: hypothetical protein CSB49_07170 [Pseudomonadota bacterium]PIE19000.1 MAG: hypothetical protein CSA65_03550 [Pseudomonadota bacterium]
MSELPTELDPLATEVADPGRRLIDAVGARYGDGAYAEEIRAAREQFDALRGRVFDDDAIYLQHMALFLEWYVLERALNSEGRPPLHVALCAGAIASEDRPLAEALARSHRSAFEVVRNGDEGLRLYDLIGDSFWYVPLKQAIVGVVRGEIVEARLYVWEGSVRLGPHVFYHPRTAHDMIHQIVRQRAAAGTLDSGLVFELAGMRLRHSRFRNIAIDRIYRDG